MHAVAVNLQGFPNNTNDNMHCGTCTAAVNIECQAVLWTVYCLPACCHTLYRVLATMYKKRMTWALGHWGTGSHQMLQKGSGMYSAAKLLSGLQADLLLAAGLDSASESAAAL